MANYEHVIVVVSNYQQLDVVGYYHYGIGAELHSKKI